MIVEATRKLIERQDLTREESAQAVTEIADGLATPAQMAAFLVALRMKGETAEEVAGAAQVVRSRVAPVTVRDAVFVDTCGTGGDGQNTFNISTAAALVAAGAGAVVAKHGNRSVSSRCGSADVLAALGVNIEVDRPVVECCIRDAGIGFMFAPRHHGAFKAVAPVRKELGIRTVFNVLGPLANPAGARHQVLGVFAPEWAPLLAQVLHLLGSVHVLVVHGDGSDEIAVTGDTLVCELRDGAVTERTVTPEQLGLSRHERSALAGGDSETNAAIIRTILDGAPGAPRDAVVANAGAALFVAGVARSLEEGVQAACAAIDDGRARERLGRLIRASHARAEVDEDAVGESGAASREEGDAQPATPGKAAGAS